MDYCTHLWQAKMLFIRVSFRLKKEKFWTRHCITKCALEKQTTEPKLLILVSFSSGEVISYADTSHCIHTGAYAGGGSGGSNPPPPLWRRFFFFFFFFWSPRTGGRRTVHMYPYPLNWRWWRSGKKSVGVPPPRAHQLFFWTCATSARLATGENHPIYKILRTLVHPHIAGSMPFRFLWATLYNVVLYLITVNAEIFAVH